MDLKIIIIMILFIILAGYQYTLSKILLELREIKLILQTPRVKNKKEGN